MELLLYIANYRMNSVCKIHIIIYIRAFLSGFTTLFKAFGTPLVGDGFLIYGNYHGNITGILETKNR